jgi:hypothetical protein
VLLFLLRRAPFRLSFILFRLGVLVISLLRLGFLFVLVVLPLRIRGNCDRQR